MFPLPEERMQEKPYQDSGRIECSRNPCNRGDSQIKGSY